MRDGRREGAGRIGSGTGVDDQERNWLSRSSMTSCGM